MGSALLILMLLFIGWLLGYFAGYSDFSLSHRPYWAWHLEKDRRWKKHVAKEYKKWKKTTKPTKERT